MPEYDGEYVNDEGLTKEVERLAMSPSLLSASKEPGAFIKRHGHKFRLDEMKSKHFQSGRFSTR